MNPIVLKLRSEFAELIRKANLYNLKMRFESLSRFTSSPKYRFSTKTFWVWSPRWLAKNDVYCFASFTHLFIHRLQNYHDGTTYYFRRWFSKKWRLKYELEAYAANILISYFYHDKVTNEQINEIAVS